MILKSTNPKFSWVTRKNPETQTSKNAPFKKSLRRGAIFGWFNEAQDEFRMFFKDSETECSFALNGDFEYLDRTRYCSPYLPIAAINELLRSAQNEDCAEDVEGFENSFRCLVELPEVRMAERFARDFPVEVKMDMVGKQLCNLTFKTQKNIRFLLNAVITFLIVQAIRDENLYIPMDEAAILKYLEATNYIDAGYYFRHSLQLRCIRSPNIFKEVKEKLTQNGRFNINFSGTQQHRFDWVQKVLSEDRSACLHDVGCGELYYTRRLNKLYSHVWAWDADEEIRGHNVWFIENRIEAGRVTSMGSYDPSVAERLEESDVLMTEVLEHMDQADAKQLLKETMEKGARRVVITVPNQKFNRFYGIPPGEFRHDDHKYEPNPWEFYSMVKECMIEGYEEPIFFPVGDEAPDETHQMIPASMGCIIKKKEQA